MIKALPKTLLIILIISFLAVIPLNGDEKVVTVHEEMELKRIAFGSCLKNPKGAQILDTVVKFKPDLFVWLGDNIYVDTNNKTERFKQLYDTLGANPRFKKLRETCPNLAVWDDHDYGNNNVNKSYPLKDISKKAFAEFWQIPKDSQVWNHGGIYQAHEYGPQHKRVQVILLDGRWFLDPANKTKQDSYLGAEQWAWLEKVLSRPAKVRGYLLWCSGR